MTLKESTEYTFRPKVKLDTNLNIRTTQGIKNHIAKIAKENNTTQSDVVNQIILNFLIQKGI